MSIEEGRIQVEVTPVGPRVFGYSAWNITVRHLPTFESAYAYNVWDKSPNGHRIRVRTMALVKKVAWKVENLGFKKPLNDVVWDDEQWEAKKA